MADCSYLGTDYAPGTVICMQGAEHRCNADGTWENLHEDCVQGDGIVVRPADGAKNLPSD